MIRNRKNSEKSLNRIWYIFLHLG